MGELDGEFGGVLGRRQSLLGVSLRRGAAASVVTCAEIPCSRTSLVRLLVGAAGRRRGKESPRLSLQGVKGVLGPVLMELGVLVMTEDRELEEGHIFTVLKSIQKSREETHDPTALSETLTWK